MSRRIERIYKQCNGTQKCEKNSRIQQIIAHLECMCSSMLARGATTMYLFPFDFSTTIQTMDGTTCPRNFATPTVAKPPPYNAFMKEQ
jgi:hypothetical protein